MTRWIGGWPGGWPGDWVGGQEASPFANMAMRSLASGSLSATLEAAGGGGTYADLGLVATSSCVVTATLAGGAETGAGRGSNLRDVWTFKPFEVRRKGKKPKRYKSAQAATTAARAEAKQGDPVTVAYLGRPIALPSFKTASYADIFDRLALVESRQRAAFEREELEALKEKALLRKMRCADDEEVLTMALARLWRL